MRRLLLLPFLVIVLLAAACTPAADEILGIEDVLPGGWVADIETTEGLIGHPPGLHEAYARVDMMFTEIEFDTEEGPLNPSLVLWFYSVGERAQVMKVVENLANQPVDVPIFFFESKNYVVLTSVMGFNYGYNGKEAEPLVPLEAALKQYFTDTQ